MDVVTLALARKYTERLFSKVDSVSISFVDALPTNCSAGSTCIVIENSSVWMLGTDKEWHKI